jgi:hypothetical protein
MLRAQEDLVGQIFHGREVISRAGVGWHGISLWLTRCEKGHEKILNNMHLKRHACGVCRREALRDGITYRTIDMLDRVIGQWTVIGRANSAPRRHEAYWIVRCSCGFETEVSGRALRKGLSQRCSMCSQARQRLKPPPRRYEAGLAATNARCSRADSFGEKKRDIQQLFWRSIPPGPAFAFVDGNIGEWRLMREVGFLAEMCGVVSDNRPKMAQFVERCHAHNLELPRIRKAVDITKMCSSNHRLIPVVLWLQKRLLKLTGHSGFSAAHLDFCCSFDGAKDAIHDFLKTGLLVDQGILGITVSYRAENWLEVWRRTKEFLDNFSLDAWMHRTPYNDSGTPMLFMTFKRGF